MDSNQPLSKPELASTQERESTTEFPNNLQLPWQMLRASKVLAQQPRCLRREGSVGRWHRRTRAHFRPGELYAQAAVLRLRKGVPLEAAVRLLCVRRTLHETRESEAAGQGRARHGSISLHGAEGARCR
jgi:hypothetical protein